MKLYIDNEFLQICKEIINENISNEEWAQNESCDMFQTLKYCGGYDATEMAFCFSYYGREDLEYWFQVFLKEIRDCFLGNMNAIDIRLVNS